MSSESPKAEFTTSDSTQDHKLNLVFLGLPESPTGTNYHSRVQNDHKAILSVLSNGPLKQRLSSVSIPDYIRLGKYNRLNEHPRPILVKFNCIKDVSSILSNCAHLATSSGSRVVIKRDLSKEERRLESFLLKKRHHLISDGVDKTSHVKKNLQDLAPR